MDLRQVMAGTSRIQEQNLINPSKVNTTSTPPGFYKSIVLDVLSIASATLFGYLYYRYLTANLSVWIVLGALTLFGMFAVLQAFLANKGARTFLVIICEIVGLLGFFWRDDWRILSITGIAVLVFLFWGYVSSRQRLGNAIEIPFFGVSGNVLSKFTTAALIFMILIYVPQLNQTGVFVSQQNFGTFFDWASGFVSGFYPNLSLGGSFGNFTQSFAKMELQNNSDFQSLNTAQQQAAVQQAAAQFGAMLSQNSSTTISSSSPTSDAFYTMFNGILGGWQNQSSGWFDVGWALVLFLALRSLGIIFVWLAQFLSLVFYEIFLASGFMKITEEAHTKEVIGY